MHRIRPVTATAAGSLLAFALSNPAQATTPAEMAAMSLQDLLNMHAETDTRAAYVPGAPGTWNFGLLYSQSRFDGYRSGSSKLSDERVIFRPGTEPRTQKNYPVLPTTITQEAYTLTSSYSFGSGNTVDINIPLIEQSTHHKSVVPGYGRFIITSKGIGDISANYSRNLTTGDHSNLRLSIGVSAPTGSIDKEGDTPREAGDQQLPYTMQLGSGTWDMPIGITYTRHLKNGWSMGGGALAKIRFGRNDRDYRLGNRINFSGWIQSSHHKWIAPFAKLSATHWEDISGQDDEITVQATAPFIYPASITDPRNFGGEKARLSIGAEFGGITRLEIGAPVYQDLNGIQIGETMNFSASWQKRF